ncbi:MAG TPA: type II secretion system F family protein [Candidatus Elarobacter sp.]
MSAVLQYGMVAGFAVSAALFWIAVAGRVERGLASVRAKIVPGRKAGGTAGSEQRPQTGAARGGFFASMAMRKRNKAFMPQLESALRMISGSLRVGLGLRQSLVIVTEDLGEPAKSEFMRVVARTNLGIGILDALDELAVRMPSSELSMTVRAIRVQAQTGGDLADLLETVADTIKARRTLQRKVQALTAEGRVSAYVILALPIGVGIFLGLTQRRMGHALLFTTIGHASIATVVALEIIATFIIMKMLKVEL